MRTLSVPEDSEADMDDDTQALLTSDFELGHYIRERIVPRAVLYYTGNEILLQISYREYDEYGAIFLLKTVKRAAHKVDRKRFIFKVDP